jgi:hypothetical protein
VLGFRQGRRRVYGSAAKDGEAPVISDGGGGADGVQNIKARLVARLGVSGCLAERMQCGWSSRECRASRVELASPFCCKMEQTKGVSLCAKGRGRC